MNTTEASKNEIWAWSKIVSNVFHPWAVLAPVLALAAYQATGNFFGCIRWTLIAFLPATVFPLLYAKIRATVLSRGGSRRKISRSLVRNNPQQLFVMTALFGLPSALILHYLNGPENLFIIILGITAVMLVTALINIKYRASFHLSMVTGMLTALWFLFGAISLISFLLIPILGLSRYQLGEHTPAQTVAGFLIGLAASVAVFNGLGLTA